MDNISSISKIEARLANKNQPPKIRLILPHHIPPRPTPLTNPPAQLQNLQTWALGNFHILSLPPTAKSTNPNSHHSPPPTPFRDGKGSASPYRAHHRSQPRPCKMKHLTRLSLYSKSKKKIFFFLRKIQESFPPVSPRGGSLLLQSKSFFLSRMQYSRRWTMG